MKTYLHFPDPKVDNRVNRLRNRIIEAPQEVCIERARYLTESMKEHWADHPLTRMSHGFENILNKIKKTIREDELIVGCRTSKLKGAPLFPENKIRWIEGDVENFDRREVQRALISEAEKEEVLKDIVPFWQGKTIEDQFEAILPADIQDDIDKYIFTFMLEITYGIGHFTMDHHQVLKKGLSGIISDAEERLNALSENEEQGEKGLFYKAAIRSMRAAIGFANQYGDLAEDLSKSETNETRKAELQKISQVCKRVPEFPAESFHEAVQSFYFIHLVSQIETGGNSISLGRVDQVFYEYYRKDFSEGRITPTEAQELLSLLYLKTNEIWNVLEEAYIPGGEGAEGKTTQNATVGGLGRDGKDATNELSIIALDAYASVRTVQPNFGVRIAPGVPDTFFKKAIEYAKDGVLLHFFNDEAVVQSLVKSGHSLEDARDYGVVGCLEPNAQGKTFGSTFAVQFNGLKCLEFALANGIDNIFGYESGLQTGDPASFKSFEEVWNAYDKQFSHFILQMVRGIECLDKTIAQQLPSPFASSMIQGPMEKGIDLTKGGAVYNSTGVQLMGFSNIADSLFAIKKVIFEDGKFSMGDLAEWLATDWLDADEKQQYFYNKVEKYGNDLQNVDEMAVKVVNHFCDVLEAHQNYRGGQFWPGIFSVGFHITMGAFTGASADGRFAGDTFGNGITPSNGVTFQGPTAIMNSITKLPLERIYNGANLNMRFNGPKTETQSLLDLLKTYFSSGGEQVQFNMVDSTILKDAQQNPDDFRDLIVRISGYSGIFVNLSDIAQDELISRSEFNIQ